MKNVEKVLSCVLKCQNEILSNIDDSKSDYLDDDWADEFDDVHEAYEEQGRGQAESYAVQGIITREAEALGVELLDEEVCEIMETVADEMGLSYN
jgi:hypothetical protein